MPISTLNARSAKRHLQSFAFQDLFVEDLGWNHPPGEKPRTFSLDTGTFIVSEISELSGFRVFEVLPADSETDFPDNTTQQQLWKLIAPHAVENILIFLDPERSRSIWLWMKRDGKKTRTRRHIYLKGQPGDLFLTKLSSLVVDLSELDEDGNLPITEAARRVKKGLDIEVVTKAFYKDFQIEHSKLLDKIGGIDDPRERRWYASVLLNRLMFIWFLQKKKFLDVRGLDKHNIDYLDDKLAESKEKGPDLYFSHVLRDLFFEGFARPEKKRTPISGIPLGNIPYLNGGLFLPHGIESRIEGEPLLTGPYQKITVPDEVFADLFQLFSRYTWSLNDTPGGDEKEINPDVLGYIFEKYINQKEFGAYYTRPEITDYLCEKTIHPLVLDRVNERFPAAQKLHESDPKTFPAPRKFADLEDLLLHADGPTCRKVLQDILPGLSILDPACGSGAFIVAAQKTLLNLYTALIGRCEAISEKTVLQWRDTEAAKHKAPPDYWLKKKIVTENLYGVDLMEEATEIAKLRLFLSLVASAETYDQLEPLPNIEFNLLPGNSLIGLLHVDPQQFNSKKTPQQIKKAARQAALELQYQESLGFTTESTVAPGKNESAKAHVAQKQAARYEELLRKKNERIELYKNSTSLFKDLSALKKDIETLKEEATEILDQLLLDQFNALGIQFHQATWDPTKKKEGKPEKRPLKIADIQALDPFHWAYEFDKIIVERGGFDIIIANPPWDVFQTDEKEFAASHDPTIKKNKIPIKEWRNQFGKLMEEDSFKKSWLEYSSSFKHQMFYYKDSQQYKNQVPIIDGRKKGGKINLFKLFLEQCTHLLCKGADCGIVIPSGIYTDLGATQLRHMLFEETTLTGIFGFENRKVVFEGVHRSFKFVVLTFKNSGSTKSFPAAFMRHDVKDLASFPNPESLTLKPSLIKKLSPGSMGIMEFDSPFDIQIAEKMLQHPVLGDQIEDTWNVKFTSEFNMTTDSDIFETKPTKESLPLFVGKWVWQFETNYADIKYWIPEKNGRARVLGRVADEGQDLDYQSYRLAFRDIARNTDTRTLISAIIPPGFHNNKLPTIKTHEDGVITIDLETQTFIAAIFNSFCLDWIIRQKVTTTLNFFYIYQLPVPRLEFSNKRFQPIVERAARLNGTDRSFDLLLQELFGPEATHRTHGVTDPQERLTLRAELDALVAQLYDLTVEEFQHILSTFPLVEEAVKSQTLNAYRNLLKHGSFPRSTAP